MLPRRLIDEKFANAMGECVTFLGCLGEKRQSRVRARVETKAPSRRIKGEAAQADSLLL